ncbi:MAG: hypothetical protein WC603_01200 [Candidatus Paceibacterota bacterium]|jgi:ABC-type polysaccharide/polyol phosphate export permease
MKKAFIILPILMLIFAFLCFYFPSGKIYFFAAVAFLFGLFIGLIIATIIKQERDRYKILSEGNERMSGLL